VNPPAKPGAASTGGLAMALAAALKEYKGIWFGWSGQTVETFSGSLHMQRVGGVTVATVDLEEHDFQEYYNGYANRTLWPLFHYRIDLTAYDRAYGQGYARVNTRFAETLSPLIEPDDLVWVHDYHLIPMARELRKRKIKNPIGFFLHIPWPAHQLVATLPNHRALVESLFDYDLIGFHTEEWLDAFRDYVLKEAGGQELGNGWFSAFGKKVRAIAAAIGIDAADFAAASRSPTARRTYDKMCASAAGRAMIVGVDRLDYSKGLEDRFLAYERFLADNPDRRTGVFLLQITPASRADLESYQEIRATLESLTGRINGAYADVDWVPIRYVNRNYRRDELAGIYRAAKIGLVTPLRDGMNLVAKEYVAAQDPDEPGVLILSRFAGAALQMKDALIVNPFSIDDVAEAIRRGLTMDKAERKRRWETLMHGVTTEDVTAWRDGFVSALQEIQAGRRPGAEPA
jgi:trehalose 6-phosphate synthase